MEERERRYSFILSRTPHETLVIYLLLLLIVTNINKISTASAKIIHYTKDNIVGEI
jgi:hypothetical protein